MHQHSIPRSHSPAAFPKREYLVVRDPRSESEPSFDDGAARAYYDSSPPTFSISNPWVPLRAPPPKPRLGWRGIVLSLVTFVIGSIGSTYLDRQYVRDVPPPLEPDAPAALVGDGPRTAVASPFVTPDDSPPPEPPAARPKAPNAPPAAAVPTMSARPSAAAPAAAPPSRGQKQGWRSRSAFPRR